MRFPLWKDPSLAMLTWMATDEMWHEDQDYISMAGADLIAATDYADHEAEKRYKNAEEYLKMADKDDNVLQFPKKDLKDGNTHRVEFCMSCPEIPHFHCTCNNLFFLFTPFGIFCPNCGSLWDINRIENK